MLIDKLSLKISSLKVFTIVNIYEINSLIETLRPIENVNNLSVGCDSCSHLCSIGNVHSLENKAINRRIS